MRIIAGTARGVPLYTPTDTRIRPTLDRVRESLFNILAPEIEGARFLDLYAGTGANGLEALSRGAAEVTFVDHEPEAQRLIRENLRRTKLDGRVMVLPFGLPEGVARIQGEFDVIFADPPYASAVDDLLQALAATPLLAQEGVVIVEHDRKQPPIPPARLARCREKQYGGTALSFYRWADA